MRKGIATVSISGSLDVKLRAIAAAHFDSVELFDADVVASPDRPEDIARRCADLGLDIDLFQPLRDIVGLTPDAFPDRLRFARAKFELMERLGATRVLLCSAVHPASVDDPQLIAHQLDVVGDVAEEHGFTLAYEALAWGSHVNRLGQARDIVDLVDRSNVGVAVDTFHLLARGDTSDALVGLDGERIAFLQIADAHALSMDVLEWSRHHRCFPGQGVLDVVGVVGAVLEAGYRGPLSLEVFSDIVREADPRDTAGDAMRSLLHLEEQLRRRWQRPTVVQVAPPEGPVVPSDLAERPRVELFDPPPAPVAPTIDHIDIAVTPGDTKIRHLLSSLGFTDVSATEQREDVAGQPARTLLRNGAATVVLDARSDLELRRPAAGQRPHIAAFAVRGDPGSALAARAQAFNLRVIETPEQGGSAYATRSPAGVDVLLDGPHPAAATGDHDGWGPLDHVGIAVDADRSDAEVSFHRTLLGLRPGPVSEFIDPVGRLRSRVLEPEAGATRIVLNIAERGTGHPSWIGANQLAYACTDLLAEAERLATSPRAVLPVPDSYYDDLAARLNPSHDMLARLRRLNVLYDRDERGGELLHLYTPLVAGRFYIELLERRGGYSGFGAANTAVRLAAQAAAPWL